MKTNLIPAILRCSCLVLVASVLTFTTSASASNDRIAASPKVRQMLNERKAPVPPPVPPRMACPKCTDVLVPEANGQAKGAEILSGSTKIVIKHSCDGCATEWTVAGVGKAKRLMATHKCTANVPNNLVCCESK